MQTTFRSVFKDTKDWPKLRKFNIAAKILIIGFMVIVNLNVLNSVSQNQKPSEVSGPVYSFEQGFGQISSEVIPCVAEYNKEHKSGGLQNPFTLKENQWSIVCGSARSDMTEAVAFKYKTLIGKPIYSSTQ